MAGQPLAGERVLEGDVGGGGQAGADRAAAGVGDDHDPGPAMDVVEDVDVEAGRPLDRPRLGQDQRGQILGQAGEVIDRAWSHAPGPARRRGVVGQRPPELVDGRLLGAVDHDLARGGGGGEVAPQPAIDPAQGRRDDGVERQQPVLAGRRVDDRERHLREVEGGGRGGEPAPVGDRVGVAAEVGAAGRAEREQLGDQRRHRIEHRRGQAVVAVGA